MIAKTAYDLLKLVAEHIEADPRRYYQDVWALVGSQRISKYLHSDPPECETVCCRAGWIVALHDGLRCPLILQASKQMYTRIVCDRANEILGFKGSETDTLFAPLQSECESFDDETTIIPDAIARPGTKQYAKFGAAGVRAFMAKHKQHLKNQKLEHSVAPLPS